MRSAFVAFTPPAMFASVLVIVVTVEATTQAFGSVPWPGRAVIEMTAPADVTLNRRFFGLRLHFSATSAAVCVSDVLNGVDDPMISREFTVRVSTEPAAPVLRVTEPTDATSS